MTTAVERTFAAEYGAVGGVGMVDGPKQQHQQQKQRKRRNQQKKKLASIGHYHFTGKRLGKGNFARVEEAIHELVNVKVAVKVIDKATIKEDYVMRNLYREATILSRLSHPCIAGLFQTIEHRNVYYMVMELISGGDLGTLVKNQPLGKLDECHAKIYGRQLISAIAYMHTNGIVHRDLKMENVMVSTWRNHVTIVDFGLSNAFTRDESLRTHCGSPEYAAPELFVEGKRYGSQVDLWSFGIILYGMVMGRLPFIGESHDEGAYNNGGGGATCGAAHGAIYGRAAALRMDTARRRKTLIEQVNKGLTARHRRALSFQSQDFRDIVARLLRTDASKRSEAFRYVAHPWITERGKRSVRIDPYAVATDARNERRVCAEVAAVFGASEAEVRGAISRERCGHVAGVHNIVKYKHARRLLVCSSDCVSIPKCATETAKKCSAPATERIKQPDKAVRCGQAGRRSCIPTYKGRIIVPNLSRNAANPPRNAFRPSHVAANPPHIDGIAFGYGLSYPSGHQATLRRPPATAPHCTSALGCDSMPRHRTHQAIFEYERRTAGIESVDVRPLRAINRGAYRLKPYASLPDQLKAMRTAQQHKAQPLSSGDGDRPAASTAASAVGTKRENKPALPNQPIARSIVDYMASVQEQLKTWTGFGKGAVPRRKS